MIKCTNTISVSLLAHNFSHTMQAAIISIFQFDFFQHEKKNWSFCLLEQLTGQLLTQWYGVSLSG